MISFSENNIRSIAKALCWRIFGSITTVIATYALTGRLDLATKVGCIEFFLKIIIYYLHERFWNLIPYGKVKEKI